MGAVDEMTCIMCVSVTEGACGDGCDLASTSCKCNSRKSDLFVKDNRCMYMAQVCFHVCCSDYVGLYGNVCCVAAVVKDSGVLVVEC